MEINRERLDWNEPAHQYPTDLEYPKSVETRLSGAAKQASNVIIQADLALKATIKTAEELELLLNLLEPVMKAEFADDQFEVEDAVLMKDFDPSSEVARIFKSITKKQKDMQDRIVDTINRLDV